MGAADLRVGLEELGDASVDADTLALVKVGLGVALRNALGVAGADKPGVGETDRQRVVCV